MRDAPSGYRDTVDPALAFQLLAGYHMAFLREAGKRGAGRVRQPAGCSYKLGDRDAFGTLEQAQYKVGLALVLDLGRSRRSASLGGCSLGLAGHLAGALSVGFQFGGGHGLYSGADQRQSLLPPPKAPPITSVRAAAVHSGRDSVTAPMLGVRAKSNGMSALLDTPERLLSEAQVRLADVPGHQLASQIRAPISAIAALS